MVRHEDPGKTGRICLLDDCAQPIQEIMAICIVFENLTMFNPPGDDVINCSWSIYPGFPWHGNPLEWMKRENFRSKGRPVVCVRKDSNRARGMSTLLCYGGNTWEALVMGLGDALYFCSSSIHQSQFIIISSHFSSQSIRCLLGSHFWVDPSLPSWIFSACWPRRQQSKQGNCKSKGRPLFSTGGCKAVTIRRSGVIGRGRRDG